MSAPTVLATVVLVAFALFAGSFAHAQTSKAATCDNPNPIRYALVPHTETEKQTETHRPLVAHLERRLGRKIAIVQAASYGTVIEGLVAGNIDLASMGPGSYALAHNRDPSVMAFATFTMRGGTFVKDGDHTYRSMLVTRRDSGIRQISDLKGKTVSLTDPASTSGAIVPRVEFAAATGAALEQTFSRITYSGSHDKSLDAIRLGYSDAAFVSSNLIDDYVRRGGIAPEALRVVWESQPIPQSPHVFRGRLCPELRGKIRQAFLADSPEIRAFLHGINAERFAAVTDADYATLRNAIARAGK